MENKWIISCFLFITAFQNLVFCILTREQIRNISPLSRPSCQPRAEIPNTQVNTTQRLADLRKLFPSQGINGYIIPSVDAHQSEYVSDYDQRRQFISGFAGSQATAVVLEDKAALWTDGRYFLQAESELDCNWILMKDRTGPSVPTIADWVIANLAEQKGAVGAYPFFIGNDEWIDKDKYLKSHDVTLRAVQNESIDQIWTTGRPQQPNTDIHGLKTEFSGKDWREKIRDVHSEMASQNVDALIVTSLDEVAWLTNSRASDVPYNPVFMSYVIVNRKTNTTSLYIREKDRKLVVSPDTEMTDVPLHQHLGTSATGSCSGSTDCIEVKDYENILSGVRNLNSTVDRIWISYACSYAIYGLINEGKIYQANTPIALMKSVKNPTEQNGLKNSHIRDGAALVTFMAHLEQQVKAGNFWTEISAATELERIRRKQTYNRGLSFETISSSGEHGAVIHYAPSNKTDKQITTTEMYLLDSGGQYLDGTTDVTRTFHFGTPTNYQKECYTRTLMGHISLTQFVFTTGLKGREIDALARQPLWKVGLDYRHGTGHGIGMYLNVHEGPGRISVFAGDSPTDAPLEPHMYFSIGPGMISVYHPLRKHDEPLYEDMFYSIEPGYYEDGEFGIRHENIAQIVKADTQYHFPGYAFLTFDTVTMVPYEPHLIDNSLLSSDHIKWLNQYNKKVQDTIGPLIKDDALASQWLQSRTGQVDVVNSATLPQWNTLLMTVFVLSIFMRSIF